MNKKDFKLMESIIIADDSSFMRTSLKNIITNGGYKVLGEAKNGKEAVDLYKKLSPNLIFLDITMPELDGLGALIAIKAINPDANIVMCSAMGQKSYIQEAIKYGAKDFIVKPFKADRVLHTIKKALA